MAMLGLLGGLIGAAGSVVGGIAANNQAKAQADALKIRAGEERAASQREAIARSREAKMALSRGQAVAANSGGGAADPTVINLMAGVAQQGEYQKGAAIYEGETRGRGLEFDAKMVSWRGKQDLLGSFVNAASGMINGFSAFNQANYQPPNPYANASVTSAGGSYFYDTPTALPSATTYQYPNNPSLTYGGYR